MKIGPLLFAVVALAGLAANSSHAQQAQSGAPKAVATSAPASSPASHRGSVGGAVDKGPKINGTGMRRKH